MVHVVCAILVREDGRVLVCQRGHGSHLGGLWEFPGGKVEPNELPEAALIREMREELAIEVSCGRSLRPVEWNYGRGAIQLLPFVCHITEGAPRALEHAAMRWCSREEFSSLDWAPADVPVWREYVLECGG